MARQRKETGSEQNQSPHAAHIALTTRLTAFQTELSAQGKSRATHEAPTATIDMAADLIGQVARLMRRAVEFSVNHLHSLSPPSPTPPILSCHPTV